MSGIFSYEQEEADLGAILSTPEGRRFFGQLISECGFFDSPLNSNTPPALFSSPSWLPFFEGQRAVAATLVKKAVEADRRAAQSILTGETE